MDPSGQPREKETTLAVEEFQRRLLAHVPVPGMQMIRSYGLYANTKREELTIARRLLGQEKPVRPEPITWREFLSKFDSPHPGRCPVCGAAMVDRAVIARSHDPPMTQATPGRAA